jgi:hypothetical protein
MNKLISFALATALALPAVASAATFQVSGTGYGQGAAYAAMFNAAQSLCHHWETASILSVSYIPQLNSALVTAQGVATCTSSSSPLPPSPGIPGLSPF